MAPYGNCRVGVINICEHFHITHKSFDPLSIRITILIIAAFNKKEFWIKIFFTQFIEAEKVV